MRIALAQLASSPDREINLARVVDAMEQAKRAGADLVAFPEVVLDRFFPARAGNDAAFALAEPIPGPVTDRIASLARELSLVTVFNLYEVDGQGRRFDSSPVFDADGRLLGVTRMLHITDYEGFHEQSYYHPGDHGMPVYDTRVGRIGVAICYDRHYPEVMRTLGVQGAELVVIPQAGATGEWPEGMYEAEIRTAAFQNGYFIALCNRVGEEGALTFAGESFVADPEGRILVRGKSLAEDFVVCNVDLGQCQESTARRLFFRHRRPELYRHWPS
ncbi:MAG TPA: nitrilase-related carbon-nitrogen hydrolase [Thermoanaerobaculia bacterium]|jgi:N-carbamoylputrescine amidase|nr:nitrilase-related carbon-nitrogen hydrolase [Thermoanaerobaculia bacterium]